ncbi:MAG: hypothetical protein Q4G23_11600, partial [Clostridia bacterium]|nr:hypothetical protein [Clostridia bacterium]
NGISVCMLNNEKALKLKGVLEQNMTIEEVDYNIVVNGNTCLRHPTEKGKKWDRYMEAYKNDKIEDLATRYRKSNVKGRLRSKIKLLIPLKWVDAIKKRVYGR